MLNKDASLLDDWKVLATVAEREAFVVALELETQLVGLSFSQKITKIVSAPISKNSKIRLFEKTIAGQPLEHGLILDETGKVLVYKPGTANQLSYLEYANQCKGKTLSHNHPANSSFSLEDIRLLDEAKNLGLSEVRAVTETEIYSLKRTGNFDSNSWFFTWDGLKQKYLQKYLQKYPQLLNANKMPVNELNIINNERFLESFSNFNVEFKIIKK